jgi:hypothetical protein
MQRLLFRLAFLLFLFVAPFAMYSQSNGIEEIRRLDPDLAIDMEELYNQAFKYYRQKVPQSNLTDEQYQKKIKAESLKGIMEFTIFLNSCYQEKNGKKIILNIDSAAKARNVTILPFVQDYFKKRVSKDFQKKPN